MIVAGDNPVSDTTNIENNSDMNKEVKEKPIHRMANAHDFLEMCQGWQNLCATQKEPHAKIKQMTDLGSILDTAGIVKASWSLFEHDGAAALKLSEISPLPPSLSAKDLPGGRTQLLNVCQIRRINHYVLERDEDSAPEIVSDNESWLNWNGVLDNPIESGDDCVVDNESDIEQNIGIEDAECPEQQDMSADPNIPVLDCPTWQSKRQAEKIFVTVNEIETMRNYRVKKK
jgi:hypothetical protein